MNELKELRTSHAKTFDLGDGKRRLQASFLQIHYEENGEWKEVDMSVKNKKVRGGIYHVDVLDGKIGFKATDRKTGNGITIELISLGGVPVPHSEPKIKGNETLWEEVSPGIDIKFVFRNHQSNIFRILKNDQAAKTAVWKVTEDAGDKTMHFNPKIIGRDANKRQTKHTTTYEDGILTDTFEGKVFEREKKKRVKTELDPVYPVEIDPTVDVFTAASNDGNAAVFKNPSDVTTYSYSNTTIQTAKVYYNQTGGGYKAKAANFYRFTGITIPQSSTINSAILKLWAGPGSNNPKITIDAKDLNNPANPTNVGQIMNPGTLASNNIVTTLTSATVQYIPFNVQTIVQELVNSFDYSNEAMMFFSRQNTLDLGPTYKALRVYMADNEPFFPGTSPELVIDYTAGASSAIKTWNGLADASVKTVNGLARASVKTKNGLA